MHRIDGPGTYDSAPPARGGVNPPGYFGGGDPASGRQSTRVTYEWCNSVQEELSTCIESAGIVLDKADNTQLMRAIVALAAGGRMQKAWTLDAAIPEGGTLNLPSESAYTVGGGALLLSWDGIVLNDKNYTEMGARGEKSTLVKLLFAAHAGSEFHAVHTAAGGGSLAVVIPPDLRKTFEAAIARADAAAQTAETAAASVGDPFYAVRG